jgi:hypothetical protein
VNRKSWNKGVTVILQVAIALAIGAYVVLSKDSQPNRPTAATPRQSEAAKLGANGILLEGVGDQAGGSVGTGYATASGHSAFGFGGSAGATTCTYLYSARSSDMYKWCRGGPVKRKTFRRLTGHVKLDAFLIPLFTSFITPGVRFVPFFISFISRRLSSVGCWRARKKTKM